MSGRCLTCLLVPEEPDEAIQPGDYYTVDPTSPSRCPSCGRVPARGSEGAHRVAAARLRASGWPPMSGAGERQGWTSLRRQVESIEAVNREAGYEVPEDARICLPYSEARAPLDAMIPDTTRPAPDAATHDMLPGSHERPGGPECRCGAAWDRWGGGCMSIPAPDAAAREALAQVVAEHARCYPAYWGRRWNFICGASVRAADVSGGEDAHRVHVVDAILASDWLAAHTAAAVEAAKAEAWNEGRRAKPWREFQGTTGLSREREPRNPYRAALPVARGREGVQGGDSSSAV